MAFSASDDFDGAEVWTRQFGTSESDEILSMAIDASGLYLAGLDDRHDGRADQRRVRSMRS